jgi:hypothetical protein
MICKVVCSLLFNIYIDMIFKEASYRANSDEHIDASNDVTESHNIEELLSVDDQ